MLKQYFTFERNLSLVFLGGILIRMHVDGKLYNFIQQYNQRLIEFSHRARTTHFAIFSFYLVNRGIRVDLKHFKRVQIEVRGPRTEQTL
jgi:hypothetical protein